MKLRAAILELVVSDMAATLAFYRRLGVAIPDGTPVDLYAALAPAGG